MGRGGGVVGSLSADSSSTQRCPNVSCRSSIFIVVRDECRGHREDDARHGGGCGVSRALKNKRQEPRVNRSGCSCDFLSHARASTGSRIDVLRPAEKRKSSSAERRWKSGAAARNNAISSINRKMSQLKMRRKRIFGDGSNSGGPRSVFT